MTDWKTVLAKWKKEFDCTIAPPTSTAIREAALESVGPVPTELAELYKASNGVSLESFKIFPIEDRGHIKQTWDSLVRANTPGNSKWLGGDEVLLKRSLIFGEFYNRTCIAMDRDNGTLWYEEEEKEENVLYESKLDLENFIELCLREIHDEIV